MLIDIPPLDAFSASRFSNRSRTLSASVAGGLQAILEGLFCRRDIELGERGKLCCLQHAF
jgi:hypothetical protein